MASLEPSFRRTKLTPAQRREAEASIYGPMPNQINPVSEFTPEQIEQMRTILLQHDANHGKIKEFDLNKPPTPPYRFKQWPTLLYDHDARTYLNVHSQEEMDAALMEGWRADPFPTEAPVVMLSVSDQREAAAVDQQLRKPRKH